LKDHYNEERRLALQSARRPHDPKVRCSLARFCLRRAKFHLPRRKYARAVAECWRILEETPQHREAKHLYLQALYRSGQIQDIPERNRQFHLLSVSSSGTRQGGKR
jgi:uncharacterized protein HemY